MNTTSGIITLKISEWSKITKIIRIHRGFIAATMYSNYFSNFRPLIFGVIIPEVVFIQLSF